MAIPHFIGRPLLRHVAVRIRLACMQCPRRQKSHSTSSGQAPPFFRHMTSRTIRHRAVPSTTMPQHLFWSGSALCLCCWVPSKPTSRPHRHTEQTHLTSRSERPTARRGRALLPGYIYLPAGLRLIRFHTTLTQQETCKPLLSPISRQLFQFLLCPPVVVQIISQNISLKTHFTRHPIPLTRVKHRGKLTAFV